MNTPNKWRFTAQDTALLIVDAQNDYLSPGGEMSEVLLTDPGNQGALNRLCRLVHDCRLRGLTCIYSCTAFDATDLTVDNPQELSGLNRFIYERRLFRKGSWGADFHPELAPHSSDVILAPHKGTDVFFSNLCEVLTQRGIEKLLLAGVGANTMVECTANTAREHGFDVSIVRDALFAFTQAGRQFAVTWALPLIANLVISSEELEELLRPPTLERLDQLKRLKLFSNSGGFLGIIETVIYDSNHQPFLRVRPVNPFRSPLYVPLGTVAKASTSRVHLNVPGQLIDAVVVGWQEEFGRLVEKAAA